MKETNMNDYVESMKATDESWDPEEGSEEPATANPDRPPTPLQSPGSTPSEPTGSKGCEDNLGQGRATSPKPQPEANPNPEELRFPVVCVSANVLLYSLTRNITGSAIISADFYLSTLKRYEEQLADYFVFEQLPNYLTKVWRRGDYVNAMASKINYEKVHNSLTAIDMENEKKAIRKQLLIDCVAILKKKQPLYVTKAGSVLHIIVNAAIDKHETGKNLSDLSDKVVDSLVGFFIKEEIFTGVNNK